MKHYKPGQIVSVNDNMYRAKKRTAGCEGCVLNDILLCPGVVVKDVGKQLDCSTDGIILVNVI